MILTRERMPDDILQTNVDWLNAAQAMGMIVAFKLFEHDSPQQELELTVYLVDGPITLLDGEFANQRLLSVPTNFGVVKVRESKVFYVQVGVKP